VESATSPGATWLTSKAARRSAAGRPHGGCVLPPRTTSIKSAAPTEDVTFSNGGVGPLLQTQSMVEMSPGEAREFWKALMDNASALIKDAHVLLSVGSFGRARSLTVLAQEELGKALWIYDTFERGGAAATSLPGTVKKDLTAPHRPRRSWPASVLATWQARPAAGSPPTSSRTWSRWRRNSRPSRKSWRRWSRTVARRSWTCPAWGRSSLEGAGRGR
jgi:AbiV family abortive infection protein